MAPLSRRRRKLYLVALVTAFAVLTPILIGYAQGYRLSDLGDAFKLIRTGGIYVAAGESGVTVSIDDEPRETTSFISRNALVQNLFAGGYRVSVSKPGFQTWTKELQVYPELVTEWHPALVADPVAPEEILKTLPVPTTTAATATAATKPAVNPRYAEAVAVFSPATSTKAASRATTTDPVRLAVIEQLASAGRRDLEKEPTLRIAGDIGAWTRGGVLRFAWLGDADSTPHYLCSPEGCIDESVVSLPNPVIWFDFALGRDDLYVVVTQTGVWLVEADGRGGRNVALIKAGQGFEARVFGDVVFLRQGSRYWEVEI
jgi:hypothetical protein